MTAPMYPSTRALVMSRKIYMGRIRQYTVDELMGEGWDRKWAIDHQNDEHMTKTEVLVATYDGSQTETDAGLHFRWPWPIQTVQHLDRRLEVLDLPPTEQLARQ